MKEIKDAADLTRDRRNANAGNMRGSAVVAESLARYGAGRSILADKEGRIIAGNTTAANWDGEIEVIKTDGRKLVVVQRTDLDLETDREARELAHADNRANQIGYTPNVEIIGQDILGGADLGWLWRDDELEALKGLSLTTSEEEPIINNFEKVPRNSGFEITVVLNSEEEMIVARKKIQDLGYFTK